MFLKDILNDQFFNSFQSLRANKEVKASIAWKLLPASKKLREHYEEFDKARVELCKKYASKDEKGEPLLLPGESGQQYTFEPEAAKAFNEELIALREVEIDLPEPKVKVSDLRNIRLSIEELEVLVGPILLEA